MSLISKTILASGLTEKEVRAQVDSIITRYGLAKRGLTERDQEIEALKILTQKLIAVKKLNRDTKSKEALEQSYSELTSLTSSKKDSKGRGRPPMVSKLIERPAKEATKKIAAVTGVTETQAQTPKEKQKSLSQLEAFAKANRSVTETVRPGSTIFVTGAVIGCAINEDVVASIKTFLDSTPKSRLVVLPVKPILKSSQSDIPFEEWYEYAEETLGVSVTAMEYFLNRNIVIKCVERNPQVADPLLGLDMIHLGKSLVVGHTKQFLKPRANGENGIPTVMASTGVVSVPRYNSYFTGDRARAEHFFGGMIIEVEDEDRFYIRNVAFRDDGSFQDIDRRYYPSGLITKARAEAQVDGDRHIGESDPEAVKFADELMSVAKPRKLIQHDIVEGAAISHHREHSLIASIHRPSAISTPTKEVAAVRAELQRLKSIAPQDCELIIVPSNHPEHYDRFLDDPSRWELDKRAKEDSELILRMAIDHINLLPALQRQIDPDGIATWLKRDSDVYVEGTLVSAHGDVGSGGAKGNPKSMRRIFGSVVSGHTHTPSLMNDAAVAGCLTYLRMGYNKGPSTWIHASVLIFKGGQKQLILCVKGKWRMHQHKERPFGVEEA